MVRNYPDHKLVIKIYKIMKYFEENLKGIIYLVMGFILAIIFGWDIEKLILFYIVYVLLEIK